MQEYIEEKAVALVMRGARITKDLLAKSMQAFLRESREPAEKHETEQSVESLIEGGADLPSIEVTGNNIGAFKRTARKYDVDFELKCDKSVEPPKWLVYFKAKDADTLTAAFNEYSKSVLKEKSRKPSLLDKVDKFSDLAQSVANPAKNRNIGELEL